MKRSDCFVCLLGLLCLLDLFIESSCLEKWSCTLVTKLTGYSSVFRNQLVRIEHKQDKIAIERDNARDHCNFMIVYQESLLWINQYLTEVNTGASQSGNEQE